MAKIQQHPDDKGAKCSFCGKSQKQVAKIIAGPSVFICNGCVDLCLDIITEEMPEPPPLAVAMEDFRRQLYDLGTQVGEIADQIMQRARREDRDEERSNP